MRTLEILMLLVRLAVLGLGIAARVRFRRLAAYDGAVLQSVVGVLDGVLVLLAWYLVLAIHFRLGFLPQVLAEALREYVVVAWLPLGWAFIHALSATGRRS